MSKTQRRPKLNSVRPELEDGFMPGVAYRYADARLANMIGHGTLMMKPDYRITVRAMKWPHGDQFPYHVHTDVCRPIEPTGEESESQDRGTLL